MTEYLIMGWLDGNDSELVDGFAFDSWPLHVTLMTWFTAPSDSESKDIFRASVGLDKPVQLSSLGLAWFGHKHNIQVVELKPNPKLASIHDTISSTIAKHDSAVLLNPEFAEQNFRPHVTVQPGFDPEELLNTPFAIHKIGLIKHNTSSKAKQIIATVTA